MVFLYLNLLNSFSGFKSPSTVTLELQALSRCFLLFLKIVQDIKFYISYLVSFFSRWWTYSYTFWLHLAFSWLNTVGYGNDIKAWREYCWMFYSCAFSDFVCSSHKTVLNVVLKTTSVAKNIPWSCCFMVSLCSPLQPLLESPLLENALVIYTIICVTHTCFLSFFSTS